MSEFDDIRPYNDKEVPTILQSVIEDHEFIDMVGLLRFNAWYRPLRVFLKPFIRSRLRASVKAIRTVKDFQLLMEPYLERMINSTISEFSVSGLDQLDMSERYLFVSNHRDITLDPALTNYAIHQQGGSTLRIAIGDNLLSKPFASHLMRLNKSFIVQRSVGKPRELLRTLKTLSRYIWQSVNDDRENVWIAQREGRAKDGNDKSDPAIIKMFAVAKPKAQSFASYMASLRIVPVSIAYEFDPCDADKARELQILADNQVYEKGEHEDLESIGKGINGYKGHVHLAFGEPLAGDFAGPEDVAAALDRHIVINYRLHSTNFLAYKKLYGEQALDSAIERLHAHGVNLYSCDGRFSLNKQSADLFSQRLHAIEQADQQQFLLMYANPLSRKLSLLNDNQAAT